MSPQACYERYLPFKEVSWTVYAAGLGTFCSSFLLNFSRECPDGLFKGWRSHSEVIRERISVGYYISNTFHCLQDVVTDLRL